VWSVEKRRSLIGGIYWAVLKNNNLVAFFVNDEELKKYMEDKNEPVQNKDSGGTEVRGS
jgi:hypothetical protein